MSTMSNILLDKEILLESGTNELEVLVFSIADYTFGINVAKVREVLPNAEITSLPKAHPSVRGVFKLRNQVIPCVSLLSHLGIESDSDESEGALILTDLNQQQTAFFVDRVERIHRLSWENVLAVPGLQALAQTPVTALTHCEGRLVLMLDFEMILDEVTDQFFRIDEVANPLGLPRENLRVLLAEDSATVREAIGNTLNASGYTNLTFFENGDEAWKWLEGRLAETDRLDDIGDLLICDVEMPQVDGLHLTKRIKEHEILKKLPVLLYSSIVTPDNHKKGVAVGADAQVAKPELTRVVELADELIANSRRENRGAALKEISDTADDQPDLATSQAPPVQQATEETSPSETPAPVQESQPTAPSPLVAEPEEPMPAPEASVSTDAESSIESPLSDEGTERGQLSTPDGIDPRLWRTFHEELTGRVGYLQSVLNGTAGVQPEETFREIARTLHTIKSASMVVPIDQVTRPTHLLESLIEAAREGHRSWRPEAMEKYLAWLRDLLSASEVLDVLLESRSLESELSSMLNAPQ